MEPFRVGEPHDLRGPVLLLAFLLLMIDGMVVFWLSGGIGRLLRWRRRVAAAIFIAALALPAFEHRAAAQEREQPQLPWQLQQLLQQRIRTPKLDWPRVQRVQQRTGDAQLDFAMRATLETRLAYVITGDAEVDAISQSGLRELTIFLANRTALEAGEPIGVDIARDELAFFPLLYWPIVPGAPLPTPAALARIDAYMKGGGTVLFDTALISFAPSLMMPPSS